MIIGWNNYYPEPVKYYHIVIGGEFKCGARDPKKVWHTGDDQQKVSLPIDSKMCPKCAGQGDLFARK